MRLSCACPLTHYAADWLFPTPVTEESVTYTGSYIGGDGHFTDVPIHVIMRLACKARGWKRKIRKLRVRSLLKGLDNFSLDQCNDGTTLRTFCITTAQRRTKIVPFFNFGEITDTTNNRYYSDGDLSICIV